MFWKAWEQAVPARYRTPPPRGSNWLHAPAPADSFGNWGVEPFRDPYLGRIVESEALTGHTPGLGIPKFPASHRTGASEVMGAYTDPTHSGQPNHGFSRACGFCVPIFYFFGKHLELLCALSRP